MTSMLQFVDVMGKLIQMIVMRKMQVSQNGLKVNVIKHKNFIKTHFRGLNTSWQLYSNHGNGAFEITLNTSVRK